MTACSEATGTEAPNVALDLGVILLWEKRYISLLHAQHQHQPQLLGFSNMPGNANIPSNNQPVNVYDFFGDEFVQQSNDFIQ